LQKALTQALGDAWPGGKPVKQVAQQAAVDPAAVKQQQAKGKARQPKQPGLTSE